jgi:hypothetical protein
MTEGLQTLSIKVTAAERKRLAACCRIDRRSQKDQIMWLMDRRLEDLAKNGHTADDTDSDAE